MGLYGVRLQAWSWKSLELFQQGTPPRPIYSSWDHSAVQRGAAHQDGLVEARRGGPGRARPQRPSPCGGSCAGAAAARCAAPRCASALTCPPPAAAPTTHPSDVQSRVLSQAINAVPLRSRASSASTLHSSLSEQAVLQYNDQHRTTCLDLLGPQKDKHDLGLQYEMDPHREARRG